MVVVEGESKPAPLTPKRAAPDDIREGLIWLHSRTKAPASFPSSGQAEGGRCGFLGIR
jgi:hypothetical protein